MLKLSQQIAHVRVFSLQLHIIAFTEPRNMTINMVGYLVLLQLIKSVFHVMLLCRFLYIKF